MIENEKVGNFLRELREKEELSQQKLGMIVYVSRQAVSQWELGKCVPDLQQAIALSKLYNISIADIYAGEIITNKEKYNSIMEFIIKSEMKKTRKIITLLVAIICVLLFIFLAYYFFNVYNKISVYTVDTIEDKYVIRGIINKSVNDIYVNFELNETVDNLCLTYKDTKLKCSNNVNYFVTKEKIGYNEELPELSHISINEFVDNLYVEINNENRIKLNVIKDYKNDNFIFNHDTKSANYNEKFESNNKEIPDKILKNFQYNEKENQYKYTNKKDEINIDYNLNNNTIIFEYKIKSKIYNVIYNLLEKKITYYSIKDMKTNEIEHENKEKEISKDIEQTFIDQYLNKYIY